MGVSSDDRSSLKRDPGMARTNRAKHRRSATMRIGLKYITPALAAGAFAAAIVAAPTAAAASTQSCSYVGGGFQDSQCQTPGNVQINDSPPPVQNSGMGYGPFFYYDRGGHR
jgi:hypothetical protein